MTGDVAYTIRSIDQGLWRLVKVQAAQDGVPVRTAILDLLAQYVAGRVKLTAPAPPPPKRRATRRARSA